MKNVELQILMPAHNEAKTIRKHIINIHKNIRKKINFSFLICEDGSSDNTLQILNGIKKKYKIKILLKRYKQGYSKAVISGIKMASAKYLLIMDSMDNVIQRKYKFWRSRHKADIIAGYRIKEKIFYIENFSDFRIIYRIF